MYTVKPRKPSKEGKKRAKEWEKKISDFKDFFVKVISNSVSNEGSKGKVDVNDMSFTRYLNAGVKEVKTMLNSKYNKMVSKELNKLKYIDDEDVSVGFKVDYKAGDGTASIEYVKVSFILNTDENFKFKPKDSIVLFEKEFKVKGEKLTFDIFDSIFKDIEKWIETIPFSKNNSFYDSLLEDFN